MRASTASTSRRSRTTGALLKRKRDAYIVRLNQIYERNLANRKVELVRARARLTGARQIEAGGRTHRRRSTS